MKRDDTSLNDGTKPAVFPTIQLSPSLEILVRTYHRDERILRSNLIPTLKAFVNRREFGFAVILDEETAADHALGDWLSKSGHCDRVVYEPLPPDWQNLFQGVAFPPPYNRWGYDRQQWSTFHADTHADADVLGFVDSDSTFYTYLTRPNIFAQNGRILLNVYRGSAESESVFIREHIFQAGAGFYSHDKVALRAASPMENMVTNRMPIWFWRSTYANCRRHIARQWNTDFESAFTIFSRGPYSAFNILANYAIEHEPEKYTVRLMDSPGGDLVTVGQNGCISKTDIVTGGLRTFQISVHEPLPSWVVAAHSKLCRDTIHLNRWARETCGVATSKARADQHYAVVHEEIARMAPEQRKEMRTAFMELVNERLEQLELKHPPCWGARVRMEANISYALRRYPLIRSLVLWTISKAARLSRCIRKK